MNAFQGQSKNLKKYLFLGTSLLCVVAFSIFATAYYPTDFIFLRKVTISVIIPKNTNAKQIVNLLKQKHIIRSKSWFLFLVQMKNQMQNLKSGLYVFHRNQYNEIISSLVLNKTQKIKITIQEGLSAYSISRKLFKKNIISDPEKFYQFIVDSDYEGYLFPTTYFMEYHSGIKQVINTFIETFRSQFQTPHKQQIEEMDMTLSEIVTLASIIERETVVPEERTIVSSVYRNRLKKNMKLQADPTVQYAIGKGKNWKKRLYYKDLKIDSLYNTYQHQGLPHGPICNPGLGSLYAALYPNKTDYLFFVASGENNRHNFSKTYEEHLKYVKKFKRKRRDAK